MKNVNYVIDEVINALEDEMYGSGKHIISTATLKSRSSAILKLSANTDDSRYCMNTGFNHLISQRLYVRGYRSIREGYHVNLYRCEDVDYLEKLCENADIALEEKMVISARIRAIKDSKCSGQMRFNEKGEIIMTLTEEEFMDKIIEDAV